MNSEMKTVVAFIFERLGKREVSPSEFYLCLSMDMRWCSVAEAKRFMNAAIGNGLIKMENNLLKPSFSLDDVSIPLGFKPSDSLFKMEASKEEGNILYNISKLLNIPQEKLEREVKIISDDKDVFRDVAALIYAHGRGKDVSEYIDRVFSSIKNET